jgi:hypothetical protein
MWLTERIPNHEVARSPDTSSERPAPNFAAVTTTQQVASLREIVVVKLAHEVAFKGAISIPIGDETPISTGRFKTVIPLK